MASASLPEGKKLWCLGKWLHSSWRCIYYIIYIINNCWCLNVLSMLRSLQKIQVRKKNNQYAFCSCKKLVWYKENTTCIKIVCSFSFVHVVFIWDPWFLLILPLHRSICRTHSRAEFHWNTMDSLHPRESLCRQELSNKLHHLDFPEDWILSQDTKHELTEIV